MFENMNVLSMAQSMARHAATRQSIIARNVANADTPGYRARDIAPFEARFRESPPPAMKATRPGHIAMAAATGRDSEVRTFERPGEVSPNGNSVSIEQEMFAAAEARSEHDRALAIYRSAINILRTSAKG
ncbi:MAG: FlgB family protein [Alphaproteobacteria bacterium]|nr:MAG: FlgB family protein [Alphaproteobacteria bacterium]